MFMLKETVEKIVVRVIDVLGDISIRTMWCLVLLPAFSFALLQKKLINKGCVPEGEKRLHDILVNDYFQKIAN